MVHLHVVRQLCQTLHIDPFELLEIPKDDSCPLGQKRKELIISQMKSPGISNEEFANTLGFEVVAIEEMRADSDFLENWTVDLIKDFAEVLKLPIQSLMRL